MRPDSNRRAYDCVCRRVDYGDGVVAVVCHVGERTCRVDRDAVGVCAHGDRRAEGIGRGVDYGDCVIRVAHVREAVGTHGDAISPPPPPAPHRNRQPGAGHHRLRRGINHVNGAGSDIGEGARRVEGDAAGVRDVDTRLGQRRRLKRVEHWWCRPNEAHIVVVGGASGRDIGEGTRGVDGNALGDAVGACGVDHGIGGRVDLQDRAGTIATRVSPARADRRIQGGHPDGRTGRIYGNGPGSGCRADRDGRDHGVGRDVDDRDGIVIGVRDIGERCGVGGDAAEREYAPEEQATPRGSPPL